MTDDNAARCPWGGTQQAMGLADTPYSHAMQRSDYVRARFEMASDGRFAPAVQGP